MSNRIFRSEHWRAYTCYGYIFHLYFFYKIKIPVEIVFNGSCLLPGKLMDESDFFSIPLHQIVPDVTLPFRIYLFINNHFVLYRKKDDIIENEAYTRLQIKKIKYVFTAKEDRDSFKKYTESRTKIKKEATETPLGKLREEITENIQEAFEVDNIEDHIQNITEMTSEAAQKVVKELEKKPYSSGLLSQLMTHSYGIYGHSINVATIAVHVALRLGYREGHILEYIGSAGLLHDIGKTKIKIDILNQNARNYTSAEKKILEQHPSIGRGLLLSVTGSPSEVRLMVYQHHENHDGSGYPEGIRGHRINELTKILSIVNTFEHLFQASRLSEDFSVERILGMLTSKHLARRFDPRTLQRIIKVLQDFS